MLVADRQSSKTFENINLYQCKLFFTRYFNSYQYAIRCEFTNGHNYHKFFKMFVKYWHLEVIIMLFMLIWKLSKLNDSLSLHLMLLLLWQRKVQVLVQQCHSVPLQVRWVMFF